MGNYNPDVPYVVGNQWAGIKEEDLVFGVNLNTFEQGYRFTVPAGQSLPISSVRAYTEPNTRYPNNVKDQVLQVNIYPDGREASTGPIQRVYIPVTAAPVSGISSNVDAVFGTIGGTVIPPSVPTPQQVAGTMFDRTSFFNTTFLWPNTNTTANRIAFMCSFDIANYQQLLAGKRILAVNIVFDLRGQNTGGYDTITDSLALQHNTMMQLWLGVGSRPENSPLGSQFSADSVQRVGLGEVTEFWANPVLPAQADILPWNIGSLMYFNFTQPVAQKLGITWWRLNQTNDVVSITPAFTNHNYNLYYTAMEIIYCEESRLGVGGRPIQDTSVGNAGVWTQNAAQVIPIHPINNPTGSLVLGPGTYVVTACAPMRFQYNQHLAGTGAISNFPLAGWPPFNSMRTYYDLSVLKGRQINRPFPIENADGQSFSAVDIQTMPQLSIHVTGTSAPSPFSHVYGRRVEAPVYSLSSPAQSLDFSGIVLGSKFTQVRYYARRWGATDQNLTATIGPSQAVITPTQLDNLPEILEGWREVTLPLAQQYSVTGAAASITWTSPQALQGDRWEILAVSAPAVSGVPQVQFIQPTYNLQQPVAQQLQTATYLAPGGDTDVLSWQSPAVSGGVSSDVKTDAVVMLAQDSPAPTLSVSVLSQAVTGVVLDCAVPPESVPTGIWYNQLTWVSPSLTGSAFDHYEIQRLDPVDGIFHSIATISTVNVLSFNDFEARVGVQSTYQIRTVNAMDFAGPWSNSANGTIPAPGCTGRGVSNSVFVFTTNQDQDGSANLAYMANYDDPAIEDIGFPESDRQKLQWMFDRDFQSAFRPLERGGESFSRGLIVQQAAVSGPQIQNGFRSMRDLAWDQLPYVCVRNEIGDRWLANVLVPAGTFQRNRSLQIVQVQITEIASAPAVVAL